MGPMVNDEGYATEIFTEWCVGTQHLSDKNWQYGLDRVDMKMRADAANNKDSFPPSTAAIWCSWCFPPKSDMAAAAGSAAESFKRAACLDARDKEKQLCIEDSGRKGRIKGARDKAMGSLKDLL